MNKKCALSSDQKKALEKFVNWLDKNETGHPFLLSGFAGSGKTYLSTKLLKIVEDREICWTVAAPTHKAVGVLRKAIDIEGLRATWHPSTIHRLLRLRLKRKGDLEICEKTNQTDKSLDQLGLVLIDEASMIDSSLLEIIINCSHQYKTRLIFVGDPAQLPPVGEDSSAVFSMKRVEKSHLNKVIRHGGPVLQLASLIREENFQCTQPPCFPIVSSNQGLICSLDQHSWLEKAKQSLRKAAEINNPDAARILCYTNRYLERLVPHARRAVHGELADQMSVLPGEVLISRRAVMTPASIDGNEVEEEPGILVGSNTEFVVEDVSADLYRWSDFDLRDQSFFAFPEIKTIIAKVAAGNSNYSIRLLPEVGSKSRSLLDQLMKDLSNKAKTLPKRDARIFWRTFFFIRDSFASLGPASVLTVHRSQGSTFKEVFVASDIFYAKNISLRKQLAYVAVSRASKEVWLAGSGSTNSLENCWSKNF